MSLGKSESQKIKSDLLKRLHLEGNDRDQTRRGQYTNWIAIFLFLGLGIAWLFYSMEAELTPIEGGIVASDDHVSSVESQSPVQAPLHESMSILDATGYVTARRQATVSSKITGKVAEVLIEEGDQVVQGQLLARLDNSLLMAQYHLSQAQFDAAKAGLLEVEIKNREAQLHLDRIRQLTEKALASQAELDQALLNQQSAQARIIRISHEIAVAESRLQLQAQQLAETEIRAPFAGVVINKAAQPGEIISPMSAGGSFTRTGICSLVDMSSLEIEVDVSESNIRRIFPGQQVVTKLNSYPQWEIPAQVITIIPAADRNKATFKVRIRILAGDPRILPNMGVRVSFLDNGMEDDNVQLKSGD